MKTSKLLEFWRKEFIATIDPDILELIRLADYDLMFGPSNHDHSKIYHGFENACKRIKEYLSENLPIGLYVDYDHPECYKDHCDKDFREDYYFFTHKELIQEIVGRELEKWIEEKNSRC